MIRRFLDTLIELIQAREDAKTAQKAVEQLELQLAHAEDELDWWHSEVLERMTGGVEFGEDLRNVIFVRVDYDGPKS